MNIFVTINERMKDLRVEKGLNQAELADELGIPKTTLSDYEHDDYPVPHTAVIEIARYFNVSTDFLLGLTDIREPDDSPIQSLRLDDSAVSFLKKECQNPHLLSEIISHESFQTLLTDAEIYVDGYVDDAVQSYNALMNMAREKIHQTSNDKSDVYFETLEKVRLVQDDYFAQVLTKDFLPILNDLREKHSKESTTSDSAFDEKSLQHLMDIMKNTPGGPVRKMAAFLNEFLKIRKTDSNMELAEKVIEQPSPERISELVNKTDLIEPNPRKRKSDV